MATRGTRKFLSNQGLIAVEDVTVDSVDAGHSGTTAQALLVSIASGGVGGAGDASAANQSTQITAANLTNTNLGGVTEAAPATDTASSGLNGRLQRIAQRLTSLIGLLPTALGTQAAATSLAVALSTEDVALLDGIEGKLDTANGHLLAIETAAESTDPTLVALGQSEYETVAASQTAQVLGPTGATGDYISGVLVIPATTTPGVVTLLDNATSIALFVGGASSVSNLVPFFIPLGIKSVSGAWKLTTGANVSCIAVGDFT